MSLTCDNVDIDLYFKCIIIGEASVGKTSIVEYYIYNKKTDHMLTPTIGVDFFSKIVCHPKNKIKVSIWDTCGQEKFRAITKMYYRDTMVVLLCFSIVNKKSFDQLKEFIHDIETLCHKNVIIFLLGTFSDKNDFRVVTIEMVNNFILATGKDIKYFEVSSVTGDNINNVFNMMIDQIVNNIDKIDNQDIQKRKLKNIDFDGIAQKKSGCCN